MDKKHPFDLEERTFRFAKNCRNFVISVCLIIGI